MTTVGFVGLGIMGRPMALHLAAAGYPLVVYGKRTVPEDVRAAGASVVPSLADLARQSEVIILVVPDTHDVEQALFASDGIAAGLAPGKLVIDMSSISPIATKQFAQKIRALGCEYLDAPVSGGEVGARAASLTIMVGGSEEAFERARPLLEKMGKNITLVGGHVTAIPPGRQPDQRRVTIRRGRGLAVRLRPSRPAKVRAALMRIRRLRV